MMEAIFKQQREIVEREQGERQERVDMLERGEKGGRAPTLAAAATVKCIVASMFMLSLHARKDLFREPAGPPKVGLAGCLEALPHAQPNEPYSCCLQL